MGAIGSSPCNVCFGRKRIMVGMSFQPNRTIAVKYEYDPCPNCQPPPHSFYAMRRAQEILKAQKNREATK